MTTAGRRMNPKVAALAVGVALLVTPAAALAAASPSAGPDTIRGSMSAQATVNQQIPLKPGSAYSRASGSAQYQAQPGQREFQVEVGRLASLRGSSVLVRVNGATVGSMKVSSKGIAQLTRNSELGQRVPMISQGSTVTVQTTAGVVLASGTF
jgi:hypothetical protein